MLVFGTQDARVQMTQKLRVQIISEKVGFLLISTKFWFEPKPGRSTVLYHSIHPRPKQSGLIYRSIIFSLLI